MIESISNLMKQAGAKQVQLTLKLTENGAQVVLNTQLHPANSPELESAIEKLNERDKSAQLRLRTALSKPLVAKGDIGELDIKFTDYITQYTESFVSAAASYNSLIDTKSSLDAATSALGAPVEQKKVVSEPVEVEPSIADEELPVDFNDEEADSL